MDRIAAPEHTGSVTVEDAIRRRRSVRAFAPTPLSGEQAASLLSAGQGITDRDRHLRAVPSAGAIYPLELFPVTPSGVFHYAPEPAAFEPVLKGDLRPQLAAAAFGQDFIAFAPLTIVITADYEKIEDHYGKRARRYTDMEAGHAAQNIHLQAVALGLGSVPIGAFSDDEIQTLLELPKRLVPIYLVPVGYPK